MSLMNTQVYKDSQSLTLDRESLILIRNLNQGVLHLVACLAKKEGRRQGGLSTTLT